MMFAPVVIPPLEDDGLPAGWPQDYGIPTLGPEVLSWSESLLLQPDRDGKGGEWRWTEDQGRFVSWWYATEYDGLRFLWDHGQVVLPKGYGKSPMAAALAAIALAGPCVPGGVDDNGDVIGLYPPSPLVDLAAVAYSQTENAASLLRAMLADAHDAIPGLDVQLTKVRTADGELSPVASGSASLEGRRETDVFADETQHWVKAGGGIELMNTIRRNTGKTNGRILETTNAWIPGRDCVAEQTYQSATLGEGDQFRTRILRWHRQAPADTDLGDLDSLRAGLVFVYAGAPWVNIDRIIAEILRPDTTAEYARRFYLNQIVSAADSLVDPVKWEACRLVARELETPRLAPGDEITLGFDGGKSDDATALVALRVEDRYAQPIKIWERPATLDPKVKWEVDTLDVDATVRWAFATYKVVGAYFDVELFESYIDQWSIDFGRKLLVKASPLRAVGWDMRGKLQDSTRGTERLVQAIEDGVVLHHGEPNLTRHVLNARRRLNYFGVTFGKEHRESSLKVDGFAALMLADMARAAVLASGKRRGPRKVLVLE